MNENVIKLLKLAKYQMGIRTMKFFIDQALAELQKGISNGTEPSEFTKIQRIAIQQCVDAYETTEWLPIGVLRLEEACDIIDRQKQRIAELEGEQDNLKEIYDKLHIDFVNRGLKIQELESENAKDKG